MKGKGTKTSKIATSSRKRRLLPARKTSNLNQSPTARKSSSATQLSKTVKKPKKLPKRKSAKITTEIDDYVIEKQRRETKTASWQNPIIAYFNRKYPKFRLKHPRPTKQKRLERKILLMLAFFSISIGLWENFRQLWLQSNDYLANDVSNIISLGTLVGALGSLLVGRFIKLPKLKRFMTITLVFRCVIFLSLAALNNSGLHWLINIVSVLDVVTGMLLLVSVYPLITTITKSGASFSRRKLVEYLFRDIGILIGGIFIGQQLGDWVVDYNACLLIATFFAAAAAWTMFRIKIHPTEKAPEEKFSAVRYILRSPLQRTYMVYTLLAGAAYNVVIGLRMLMLTDFFGFSAGIATNYLLIAGLIADILGILALKFFTPKNDYLTLSIKFGTRLIIFIFAAMSNNDFLCFIALTWTILSSTAYEDITDGNYINSVDNRYQLKYNTIRYVIHHSGIALGTFLCGQVFQFGPGAIFALSAVMIVFQLTMGFRLIKIRQQRARPSNTVRR